jgi:hypothetical protein
MHPVRRFAVRAVWLLAAMQASGSAGPASAQEALEEPAAPAADSVAQLSDELRRLREIERVGEELRQSLSVQEAEAKALREARDQLATEVEQLRGRLGEEQARPIELGSGELAAGPQPPSLQDQAEDLEAERAFKEHLVKQLQLRETELKEAEAIISLLQRSRAPQPAEEPPASPAEERHPVKVFQINEELRFLVLSNPAMEGVTEGSPLVLETMDRSPVATIQFVERDRVGFAVASVLEPQTGAVPVRKGDELYVRLPSASP